MFNNINKTRKFFALLIPVIALNPLAACRDNKIGKSISPNNGAIVTETNLANYTRPKVNKVVKPAVNREIIDCEKLTPNTHPSPSIDDGIYVKKPFEHIEDGIFLPNTGEHIKDDGIYTIIPHNPSSCTNKKLS
ncbi:hypothetical protein NIES4071_05810 [Calothrix sp. NIES-4071]|nr:hypothetical protein NIES4071_05810 [Calothrix sp. NIES-4071]BAZ54926.1 hypothetical protein NIES4105_05800 [Calothrix sp. NIES-4105]